MNPLMRTALNWLAVMVLALTAFVVGGAADMFGGPFARESAELPGSDNALLRGAAAYYDGINQLLDTGDSSTLERQLDDRFTDTSFTGGDARSASQLISSLESLRGVYPDLRYEVTDLVSRNDLVFATIRTTGGAHGEFAGIALPPLEHPEISEVLRVRNGVISARWHDAPAIPNFTNIAATPIQLAVGVKSVPELRRWSLQPNATGRGTSGTWLFLVVEQGTFDLTLDADDPGAISISANDGRTRSLVANFPNQLMRGDLLILPGGAPYHFWNAGNRPASVVAVEMPLATAGANSASVQSGVTRTLLARGVMLDPQDGTAQVAIGTATFPSGAIWTHDPIADGGELVGVDNGSIVVTSDGLVWTADEQGVVQASQRLEIGTGDGAAIESHGPVTYRADAAGSTTVWIVTLSPADSSDGQQR